MGCFWSSQGREHCMHCNRAAVNNLVIIDHICEICIDRATRTHYTPTGPKYGEYRCSACQRYWNSRCCWPDKYQMCKLCKIPTLPYKYRDLKPTDISNLNDNGQEHVRELCQMCQQLGYSCKNFGKNKKPPSKRNQSNSRPTKNYDRHHKKW